MNVSQGTEVFTEIFPVRKSEIPRLFGYNLQVRGGDFSTIGGKLSYRLRKKFSGHWVWTGDAGNLCGYRFRHLLRSQHDFPLYRFTRDVAEQTIQ